MSRKRRPYMPGMVFHIYARTIGRAAWFDEQVRDAIVQIIAEAQDRSDARLLAFVVGSAQFDRFPDVSPALSLFADEADPKTYHAAYNAYMQWRSACANCETGAPRLLKPRTRHGDETWAVEYGQLARRWNPKPDLRDIVLRALRENAPGLSLTELRLRRGGPKIVAARRAAIARALQAGHRGVDIAAFLGVPPMTVSRSRR